MYIILSFESLKTCRFYFIVPRGSGDQIISISRSRYISQSSGTLGGNENLNSMMTTDLM